MRNSSSQITTSGDRGAVRVSGSNEYGQIGDGSTVDRNTPTPVSGVRNVVSIAATGYSSVAALSDGTVIEWGATYGNLTPRRPPAPLAGARGRGSAAVLSSGHIMIWSEVRPWTRPGEQP